MSDGDRARGVDRRRVLRLLVGGSGLAAAGMIGVPVGRYLVPPESLARDAVASLRDDEIGPWEARQVVVAGRPVLVLNTGDGYRAFSAVCTHLGCVVKWSRARRQFLCPCHGARFDADGVVRGGPAPRPLAQLEVTELPGTIEIRRIAARPTAAETEES